MKRETPTDQGQELPYVPQDIVEEILSRLPSKSLMRFKSVSPSFNNVISETCFCNSHLKQSTDHNRIKMMYLQDCKSSLVYESRTGRLVDADERDSSEVSVLAHCNGLFCLGVADDIFLCNPSTQQSRKVPSSQIEFPTDSCTASVFFGLGYHSSSNDYKLVRIAMFEGEDFRTEVKIYSRNTDTWQRIQDFPYEFPFARPGVFVNNHLHWIVSMWDDDAQVNSHNVVALDLTNHNYDLIPFPYFGSTELCLDIGSLDEKLIMFYPSNDCTSDIWILTQQGGAQPWTRIKIKMDFISSFESFVFFQPLCLLKSGEILVRVGAKKVVSLDVEKKRCYDVSIPHMLDCKVVSYVESLVSPYAT